MDEQRVREIVREVVKEELKQAAEVTATEVIDRINSCLFSLIPPKGVYGTPE